MPNIDKIIKIGTEIVIVIIIVSMGFHIINYIPNP